MELDLQKVYQTFLGLLSFFLPITCLILFILITILLRINGDLGWLFYITREWLAGKELYTQLIEVNPPMIIYLMAPAVWLANMTDFSAAGATKIYFSLFVLIPTIAHINLSRLVLPEKTRNVYIYAVIFITFVVPFYDFGQRDHLAIILLIPYLFVRYLKVSIQIKINSFKLFLYGVFAGIALCLKPYFIIIPFFSECFLLYQFRKEYRLVTIEPVTAVLFFCGFITSIFIFHPQYFSQIVPLALATYWTYGKPISSFGLPYYALMVMLIFIVARYLTSKKHRELVMYFNIILLASFLSFLIQSHYSYQLLPFKTILFLNFTLTTCLYVHDKAEIKKSMILISALACYLLVFSTGHIFYDQRGVIQKSMTNIELPKLSDIGYKGLDHTAEMINNNFTGKNIYIFSTNVWPSAFITSYTRAIWSSSFGALWPIPAIAMARNDRGSLSEENVKKIDAVTNYVVNIINHDLTINDPAIIVIDVTEPPSYFYDGFEFETFISQNKKMSDIFKQYQLTDIKFSIHKDKKYKVYTKKSNPVHASSDKK